MPEADARPVHAAGALPAKPRALPCAPGGGQGAAAGGPAGKRSARWWRGVLLICGTLALVLGLVGIFLPLVPTTPFVLLAAACYARASTRAHGWLLNHRWFGPLLRRWREQHAVPASAKLTAMVLIGVSFAASLLLLPNCGYGYVTLFLIGSGLVIIVGSLPSARN